MIRIENQKTGKGDGFYVGRPTPLGNPFKIDAKTSRAKAVEQYRDWLRDELVLGMQAATPVSKAFKCLVDYYREHGQMTLICWCAPLQCHAEVIRDFVLKAMKEKT